MTVVERCWWTLWLPSTVFGALLAITSTDPAACLVMGLIGAATSWWVLWAAQQTPAAGHLPADAWRTTVSVGAAGAIAVLGYATLAGPAGPTYAVLLLVGVGAAVRRLASPVGTSRPSAPPPAVEHEAGELTALRAQVRGWSWEEISRDWRVTGAPLRLQGADARTQARSAARREILLDELERRDPARFASWVRAQTSP